MFLRHFFKVGRVSPLLVLKFGSNFKSLYNNMLFSWKSVALLRNFRVIMTLIKLNGVESDYPFKEALIRAFAVGGKNGLTRAVRD